MGKLDFCAHVFYASTPWRVTEVGCCQVERKKCYVVLNVWKNLNIINIYLYG